MHEGQNNVDTGQRRPPRIRLPFEKRTSDPGEWSYDHRAGICITLILYMLLAIAFLWWKLDFGGTDQDYMLLVDIPEEIIEKMETDPTVIEQQFLDDYSNVRNLASNENAELNSQLRDAKGTNASEIYESASALESRLAANREAYEEGLKREAALAESLRKNSEEGGEATSSRVQGSVTVSYSFSNPVRHDVNLIVPAYRCRGEGQVVVNATLDINGNVVSASVEKSLSSSDDCMQSTALGAARSSRFNVDQSAPSRQRGTITYIFIPQ